ncbi:MAG TPA: hypothetical protein VEI02_08545, partial [Planctomycetota bacterium]|nr:hypothetical protein [Planctomycetota bacterium]
SSAPTAPTDSRPWRPAATAPVEEVDVDLFDPWLGRTYRELAAEARSMHKSQGMSRTLEPIGPPKRRYRLLIDRTTPGAGRPDAPPLFGGVDFAPKPAPPPPPVRVTVYAEGDRYWMGDDVAVVIDAARRSDEAVRVVSATLRIVGDDGRRETVAESRPSASDDGRDARGPLRLAGTLPWNPPWEVRSLDCEVVVRAGDAEHVVAAPVRFRHAGDVLSGEQIDPVLLVPPWELRFEPGLMVVTAEDVGLRKPLRVAVRRNARRAGVFSASFRASDPAIRFETVLEDFRALELDRPGDAWFDAALRVDALPARTTVVDAQVLIEQGTFEGLLISWIAPVWLREIDDPHVERRTLATPAAVRVVPMDLRRPPPTRVGYVQGVGEATAKLLPQLGAEVELLDAEALATSDLARFDVLVIGARAYEFRPDLRAHQRRLMDRVAGGGVLICQYQKSGLPFAPYAPFEATVGAGRVTDENGPVEHLVSDHPALTAPNRLGVDDWRDWFRDRSLYHLEPAAATRDRYVDLVKPFDTFGGNAGPHLGALVEARVGKGRWIYCGLALWRQLPEAVPGAWRLWSNLLALRGD